MANEHKTKALAKANTSLKRKESHFAKVFGVKKDKALDEIISMRGRHDYEKNQPKDVRHEDQLQQQRRNSKLPRHQRLGKFSVWND